MLVCVAKSNKYDQSYNIVFSTSWKLSRSLSKFQWFHIGMNDETRTSTLLTFLKRDNKSVSASDLLHITGNGWNVLTIS